MGVPPAANSNLTHGRRKFLGKNKNEDRAGIPRLDPHDSGASKTKGSLSKAKVPQLKKAPKSKKKAVPESSSEENFRPESNDDMYLSDSPKPNNTTENLEVPFSNSPRATRSMRGKRHPEPLADRGEEKRRKVSKKGKTFVDPRNPEILNTITSGGQISRWG